MAILNIDLVPYDCTIERGRVVVHDVGGSVLAKLDVPARYGWTEYYGAWLSDDVFASVGYDSDEEKAYFGTEDLDLVAEWLDRRLTAIDEIGFEILSNLPN